MFNTFRSDDGLVDVVGTGQLGATAYNFTEENEISGDRVENYIPLRPCDLRDRLLSDNPDVFDDASTRTKFLELYELLRLRSKIRIMQKFGEWQEAYAYLDPDVDVGLPPPGSRLDCFARSKLSSRFQSGLTKLLEVAEFQRLSKEQLDAAMKAKSLWGVEMNPPPASVEFSVFARGKRQVKLDYTSWRTCFKKVETSVTKFERLVFMFKLSHDEGPKKSGWPWHRKTMKVAAVKLNQRYTYLKMFKDILEPDVDMLLPGSSIKMSMLEYVMMWGPVLFGLGSAIYKLANGTFNFSSLINTLTSLGLVAFPLSWGFNAYNEHKKKMHDMKAHLNKVFLMHNVTNNASVLSYLLDEAHEQELSEMMLAYFYLWRGQHRPAPQTKPELDRAVEGFLDSLMAEHDLHVRIDYEVADAVQRLITLGLVTEIPHPSGKGFWIQACGLDEALEQASLKYVKLLPRGSEQAWGAEQAAAPVWHECIAAYPGTGQKIRYFWNQETNESSYEAPEHYIPAKESL